VGWTVAGRLPRRTGQAGHRVVSWADGTNGWAGWLAPEEHPRLASPQVARVFSANHRKLGSPAYLALAQPDGHLGARATQIRDALNRLTRATPADMVAIQLDDRARLLDRWRDLLRATLQHPGAAADRTNNLPQVDRLVADWHGRATPDSVAYRILRGFRMATLEYIFEPLTTRAAALSGERFWRFADGAERPVWTLLEARPPHLLNPRFATYDDLLLAAVHATVDQLRAAHGGDLAQATWGRASNHPVQHPVSSAVPRLAGWLDLPLAGCGGGDHMPRVHNRWGGSSERLVVSPGHEAEGLIQMFGGQSGHCLSPFYRAGHDAWVRGEPKPLLPGPARHKLRLVPRGTR
jgi:penicillin amidase